MSLFEKKGKNESVKVLSEKDIQNKLYGKYRTNSDTTFAPVIPAPKTAVPSSPKPKESVPGTEDLFLAAGTDSKTESPIVIKPGGSQEGPVKLPEGMVKPKDSGTREQIGKWVREENKVSVSSAAILKKDDKHPLKKVLVVPQKAGVSWKPLLEKILKSVGAVLQGLLGLVAGGVRGLVDLLLKFISGIDLSNPRVRQALYWLSVGGVLAVIFFGIHSLNDKREVAMKGPPKATRATTTHKMVTTPVPPKVETRTEGELSSEVVKSSESSTDTAHETVSAATEPASANKVFVVQVATYVNEDDARQVVDRFHRASFAAFVKVQRRAEGKHFYSVFLGPYESFRKAQEDLAKFKKNEVSKPFQDAFIRSVTQ
jgi:cell division septation protein DedD